LSITAFPDLRHKHAIWTRAKQIQSLVELGRRQGFADGILLAGHAANADNHLVSQFRVIDFQALQQGHAQFAYRDHRFCCLHIARIGFQNLIALGRQCACNRLQGIVACLVACLAQLQCRFARGLCGRLDHFCQPILLVSYDRRE
jgi:hypothetical protein